MANHAHSAGDPRTRGKAPPFDEHTQSSTGSEAAMAESPDYGAESYVGRGRLTDKIALVTGGDSGIGRAVALAFAREGADVAIGYHSHEDDAAQSFAWIERAGRRGAMLQADLARDEECRTLVARTVETFGRIDVLVNNAAHQGKALERFEELSDERLVHTFATNILAMFRLVRHALPHLGPGSAIINVASIQAYQPSPAIIDYASTKGAIVTFTKALAEELATRGIRVNAVAPGPVWTPIIAQSFDAKKVREFGANTPFGRPAQPVELAPAFVFLASDEASYVSGEVLGVTGAKVLP